MSEYLKLEMPDMTLFAFMSVVNDAMDNPYKEHTIVNGSVTYNPKEERFIFHIPPEFMAVVSDGVFKAVRDKGITQEMITSKATFVTDKE